MAKRERKATPNHVFSHWFQMIEGFQTSPSEFYKAVEQAIHDRGLPDLRITQVTCQEGGFFSAKRMYLRVKRRDNVFDICGAPFGKGFFFSWWLGDRPPGFFQQIANYLAQVPVFRNMLQGVVDQTYFQIDTMLMFQQAVSAALNEVIDQMLAAQGVRPPLTADEKKPIMNL